MTPTALLVRTHYRDEQVDRFIATLAETSSYPVFALVDESRHPVDFGGVPKLSVGPALAAELGVFGAAPNLHWRCGDYALYAARRALPHFERLWMIEPDVRIRLDRPGAFFEGWEGDDADFVAAHLRPAEPSWDWGRTMADGGPVFRCLYPLVRLSGRALDKLLERRRKLTAAFVEAGRDPQFWPNDEVFTATTLMRAGFVCRDLNAQGTVYEDQSFGFWWPMTDRQIAADGEAGRVYHPVHNGDRYFQKLFQLACRLGDFAALEGAVEALTGVEWPEEKAEAYRRAIALAKSCAAA